MPLVTVAGGYFNTHADRVRIHHWRTWHDHRMTLSARLVLAEDAGDAVAPPNPAPEDGLTRPFHDRVVAGGRFA